jgi:3',5'-cyclic AMP phosphodiesterase CpdA
MRIVAHLSDLHFGRVDAALLDAAAPALEALAPDLIVVSGDLTQRAQAGQFRRRSVDLDTLPKPAARRSRQPRRAALQRVHALRRGRSHATAGS